MSRMDAEEIIEWAQDFLIFDLFPPKNKEFVTRPCKSFGVMKMLNLRQNQLTLWDAILPEPLRSLPPELEQVDQLLDDERFLQPPEHGARSMGWNENHGP
ncbi:hypothetical protein [Planifilum fulgidum]|uniref:hypothetical protein n=1 Tax=Planifilum fulgidum TaxID=201973 RepID=UPI0011608531|nr:hypothetical protein [Planifilum fulgidum]